MRIQAADSPELLVAARSLIVEYAASLSFDLCFQDFDKELAELPGEYAPPSGRLLLAVDNEGRPAGCVALRPCASDIGEMKRLYVRPEYRGQRVGKRLVERLVAEARNSGYSRMRLDTTPEMSAAISLYKSLGFVRIDAYRHNPVPGAEFYELDLNAA